MNKFYLLHCLTNQDYSQQTNENRKNLNKNKKTFYKLGKTNFKFLLLLKHLMNFWKIQFSNNLSLLIKTYFSALKMHATIA